MEKVKIQKRDYIIKRHSDGTWYIRKARNIRPSFSGFKDEVYALIKAKRLAMRDTGLMDRGEVAIFLFNENGRVSEFIPSWSSFPVEIDI